MKPGDQSLHAPPVIPGIRRLRRWWLLGIIPVAAMIWVLYRFNPSLYGFYPRCLFYETTGLLCPGCGAQRAMHQLVHGNVLMACRDNLLFILALPWVAYVTVRYAIATLRGSRPPAWIPSPRSMAWIGAIMVVFTILRNLPGAPFCYLAPP